MQTCTDQFKSVSLVFPLSCEFVVLIFGYNLSRTKDRPNKICHSKRPNSVLVRAGSTEKEWRVWLVEGFVEGYQRTFRLRL